MKRTRNRMMQLIVLIAAAGLCAAGARAGHSHFELEPDGGTLVVPGIGPDGTFSPHNPEIDENTWYWDPPTNSQFREYRTDDPGLMADAEFYTPEAQFTWQVTSSLKFFDPATQTWGQPLNDEQLILSSGTYPFEVTIDADSGHQTTGVWAAAEDDGSIHAHVIFGLSRASNSAANPVEPADGVYAFEGYMTSDSYNTSNSFHMALGLNAGEGPGSTMFAALEALPPIPEPASSMLLVGGLVGLIAGRRRGVGTEG